MFTLKKEILLDMLYFNRILQKDSLNMQNITNKKEEGKYSTTVQYRITLYNPVQH